MKTIHLDKGREISTPWLSIDEAAAYCGMSRETFRVKAAEVPFGGTSRGRKYYIPDLDEWMKTINE